MKSGSNSAADANPAPVGKPTPSWLFGLKAGTVAALLLSLVMTAWDWLENPGGIFHGPGGTQWGFVAETAISWLVPTFFYAAAFAAVGHLLWTAIQRRRAR